MSREIDKKKWNDGYDSGLRAAMGVIEAAESLENKDLSTLKFALNILIRMGKGTRDESEEGNGTITPTGCDCK